VPGGQYCRGACAGSLNEGPVVPRLPAGEDISRLRLSHLRMRPPARLVALLLAGLCVLACYCDHTETWWEPYSGPGLVDLQQKTPKAERSGQDLLFL
jgi:hypothetical protein